MLYPRKHHSLPLLVFFILLVIVVAFSDIPGNTMLIEEIQNTGHTIAFGFSAIFSLWLLRHTSIIKSHNILSQYLVVFALCLIAGITVELLQWMTNRDAEVSDVIRDLAGIISFLGCYSLVDKNITSGKNKTKKLILFTSLVVLVAALYPLARLTYVYNQRNQAFPTLIDFGSSWFENYIVTQNATLKVVAAPDNWTTESGKLIARITLHRAKYPGLHLREPLPDWRGYTHLHFKILSPKSARLSLAIRFRNNNSIQKSYDQIIHGINIKPGNNTVRIALQNTQVAPGIHQLNMKEITGVLLYGVQLKKTLIFYLSNIWLD